MGWNFVSEPPAAATSRVHGESLPLIPDAAVGESDIRTSDGLAGSSAGTVVDYLHRMADSHLSTYGVPMESSVLKTTMRKLLLLESLVFEDSRTIALYNDPAYWESVVGGRLHVGRTALPIVGRTSTQQPLPISQLSDDGYTILRNGAISTSDRVVFDNLATGIAALLKAGWPPTFLLVYDEVWQLLAQAADTFNPILGEDCWLEPDINVWALRPEPIDARTEAGYHGYIGQNFGKSHRDMRFDQCHDPVSGAFRSCNAWIPINPSGATERNGCMSVVPIEQDDFFFSPTHPSHMATGTLDIKHKGIKLIAAAGDICTWLPSAIHWGNACEVNLTEEPRISIAATFRRCNAPRSNYGDIQPSMDAASDPPRCELPIPQRDILSLSLEHRLSSVAKALLAFCHWYPGFPGLSVHRLERGAS
eukprot:m.429353 g.429353  ORF g.429353 m.429353 type:complete len:420 (-) comp16994_c0_seq1:221-1480(-)